MKDGARAAAIAVGAIGAYCASASASTHPERLLRDALLYGNEEVFRVLGGEGGAAVVVAAVSPSGRFVAHAGDSRAYLATSDSGLTQLTVDDTVKAQLEKMGRAADDGARLHSQLLQFVGIGKGLEPHVAAVPAGGRGVILMTDGVHSIPIAVMEWIARGSTQLVPFADRLVAASDGKDNGTVVVVSFQNDQPSPPRMGCAEFWLPGDHVVVVPALPTRYRGALPHPVLAEPQSHEKKSKTRKPRTKKSAGKTGLPPVEVEPPAPPERELPIMTFKEPASPPSGPGGAAKEPPAAVEASEHLADPTAPRSGDS